MKDRTVVCPCEDVTVEDIREAIDLGYIALEPLKRVTAATTGPCQGKWCLHATVRLLAKETGQDPEALGGITHRQPVRGVPLGALAKHPLASDDEGDNVEEDEA